MTPKQLADQRASDWRWLMGQPEGRRILAELISDTGFMLPSMSDNPLRTAHHEGRRSIGGEIYARLIRLCSDVQRPALLAEVLQPSDVRSTRSDRTSRDDPDDAGGPAG